MTSKDWFLLIILSILWGGSFFFGAVAVKQVPPLTVTVLRVSIAALVLLLVLRGKQDLVSTLWRHRWSFLIMGLVNNLVPFGLLFWAQTVIPSGLASILNASTPMFAILVAHFSLADERMTTNKVAGVLLGVVGVTILVGADVLLGIDRAIWGMLACLGAALSYGIAGVYGRRFAAMEISPNTGAFGQLAASTIIATPIILLVDQPWKLPFPTAEVVWSVIALAVFSTALAYMIYFQLLKSAGAVNVVLVTLLVPVSAIFLGTIALGEEIYARHLVGLGLIAFGLAVIDGRLFHLRRS